MVEFVIDLIFSMNTLIVFSLLMFTIAIHEFGHMIVAILCGVKVEAFSIGFGKILLHKKFKGIDFRLSLIPLGGYCSMAGEDIGPLEHDFASQPYWKKVIILIAGVSMNLLMALTCYVILYQGNILTGLQQDILYLSAVFTKNYAYFNGIEYNWLRELAVMNLFCFIGNLIPIVPLDGGHIWYQKIKNKFSKTIQKVIIISGIIIVIGLQFWMLYYLCT